MDTLHERPGTIDPDWRSPATAYAPPRFTLLGSLAVLLRERWLIVGITLVGMAVAILVASLRDRTYTTVFSFMPQTVQDPSRAGLASLAGQFGVSLPTGGGLGQSPQLYADLLKSREVLLPIVADSFVSAQGERRPLPQVLDIEGESLAHVREKTLRALRLEIIDANVATRTTGVVTVRVKSPTAQASLAISERLLSGLNRFNLTTRQSQAREERRFSEQRLSAARRELRAAENALEGFLRRNRQYSNAPQLVLEESRLRREVDHHQTVVTGLAQQYEEIRIREVRDIPVLTVIDRPTLAVEADPRGRVLLLVGGTLAALFIGVLAAFLKDRLFGGEVSGGYRLAAEWRRLRGATS